MGQGVQEGFPLGILRLSLDVCSFIRHLALDGVVSEGGSSLSAILAGTSFATDLLYLVVMGPCDRLERRWSGLNLSLVVDDLAIQAVETESNLGQTVIGATKQAMKYLTRIGCMVSAGQTWLPEGKTAAVGSGASFAPRLSTSFRAIGVQVRRHARHLGVDYAPGKRAVRLRPVARQRMVATRLKVQRVRNLGLKARAAERVLRAQILPGAVHGAEVTGVIDKQLRELLSLSHRTLGHTTSGRSAYARLYLQGGLPGVRGAVAPIFQMGMRGLRQHCPRGGNGVGM